MVRVIKRIERGWMPEGRVEDWPPWWDEYERLPRYVRFAAQHGVLSSTIGCVIGMFAGYAVGRIDPILSTVPSVAFMGVFLLGISYVGHLSLRCSVQNWDQAGSEGRRSDDP
jgi:hypothetical protein